MSKPFVLLLVATALLFTGCSFVKKQTVIGDQAETYRKAIPTTPLQIPTDLTHHQIGSKTELLPTNVQTGILNHTPLPPGSLADQIATGQVSESVLNNKLPEPK